MIEEKAFKNWIVAKPTFSNQMNMLYVYTYRQDTMLHASCQKEYNKRIRNKNKGEIIL